MELILGILAFLVMILTILQGWQMRQNRRHSNNNPGSNVKLDKIIQLLGRMEQRLEDVWDKVKDT